MTWRNQVFLGSSERMTEIPDAAVHSCVTSPPYYGLREYEADGQLGHEATVAEYVERLVGVFREVRRVLRADGTLWLNLGDSYAAKWARNRGKATFGAGAPSLKERSDRLEGGRFKEKDLMGIPWRVAFALQADGWWLRDAIVWAKPNPMPSSLTDRCTSSYEMVFMLAKSKAYYANMDAVREPLAEASLERIQQAKRRSGEQKGSDRANGGAKTNGPMRAVINTKGLRQAPHDAYNEAGANLRNVWTIVTTPFSGDHPAVMPRMIAQRCILIGTPPGGIVLDPFMGSGTVAEVAIGNGREYVGYELNPAYHRVIADRLGLFGEIA